MAIVIASIVGLFAFIITGRIVKQGAHEELLAQGCEYPVVYLTRAI